jgi:prepilin-type N-terminal cleavage/methylation domain-containing protein
MSVTGPPNSPGAARGFTLLEVVVVVALIGILVVMVSVRAPDRAAQVLGFEAERFATEMNACRERAMLSGLPHGVRVGVHSYDSVRFERAWHARDNNAHELPDPIEFVLWPGDADRPVLICLPSGETETARFALAHRGRDGAYEFVADLDGTFTPQFAGAP